MSDIGSEKFLLSLGGVTRFDLPKLKLKRFLLHDMPFAVFDESGSLHIKLSRGKVRMLSARYQDYITESELYGSARWAAVRTAGLDESAVYDLLIESYQILSKELSALSRTVYQNTAGVKYDLNYKRIIKEAEIKLRLDYGKNIVGTEEE